GKFTFKKLYPTASYTLSIWHKDWKTDTTMTVEAAPEGETTILKEPMKVLMTVDNEGIITDTATRLQWYVGTDMDTNWDEANLWVKSLSVGGGGGWRMPARAQLKGLYDAGMEFDHWVWSGEVYSPSEAWAFLFSNGYDVYNDRSDSSGGRAFAVRNR
ncbi:MAG: DUF1566 domain-containing protein, partial [Nitrospirae bacterium]|nr:DUF1566 domain-containing protein [Nitrospirota bacterium]